MKGAAGLIALLGTTPVALWGGTLCIQGRFVRGTVLEKDASYEGALL